VAKLPRISGKELLRFLQREGFTVVRVRGSHHVLTRDETDTVVPVHGNRTLALGTLRKILRDIDMTLDEFVERFNT
jgi:predicted RNA binding protein YcfA (HicA-like mRNA interferase family)